MQTWQWATLGCAALLTLLTNCNDVSGIRPAPMPDRWCSTPQPPEAYDCFDTRHLRYRNVDPDTAAESD